ncbi:hypothetical protein BDV95DRAFT_567241 [Massariosphaeria phaeospora]|uniref:Uncharacterized protein n=1 Tax=Massariosphaeria phaeospora TaxID=100035 RepID=A0A7C8MHN7_9PLEO|nr:hypothetical protein BDV95DRAFT_567241 [Massariosphaeria phaeospora]
MMALLLADIYAYVISKGVEARHPSLFTDSGTRPVSTHTNICGACLERASVSQHNTKHKVQTLHAHPTKQSQPRLPPPSRNPQTQVPHPPSHNGTAVIDSVTQSQSQFHDSPPSHGHGSRTSRHCSSAVPLLHTCTYRSLYMKCRTLSVSINRRGGLWAGEMRSIDQLHTALRKSGKSREPSEKRSVYRRVSPLASWRIRGLCSGRSYISRSALELPSQPTGQALLYVP